MENLVNNCQIADNTGVPRTNLTDLQEIMTQIDKKSIEDLVY